MNIDVKQISTIKPQLDSLQTNDALFIEEDGKTKYVIINTETYDKVSDLLMALDESNPLTTEIKVIGEHGIEDQLTYEEYERVKSLIMDAVDKTFKPKAEKLN